MPLVTELPSRDESNARQQLPVRVDRHTLEKRRWRIRAEDGTDIAVDLEKPCSNGDVILTTGNRSYFIDQAKEPVIRILVPDNPTRAARMGWLLGNQHLPVELREGNLLVAYDEQLLAKLDRLGIHGETGEEVFSPDPHSRSNHHHH